MATKKLVESIHRGDFSVVEPLLVPGSSLHKFQRGLVARLGREGVKEQTRDSRRSRNSGTLTPGGTPSTEGIASKIVGHRAS